MIRAVNANQSWGISDLPGLTPHQQQQLDLATSGRIGCLTGGPGTGKTFTTAALINGILKYDQILQGLSCLDNEYDRIDTEMKFAAGKIHTVGVAAPTGKAAVRITEQLASHKINLQASTIHTMLGIVKTGYDNNGWDFLYNARRTLPLTYLFIDECFPTGTLVDTPLGRRPIEKIYPGHRIYNALGVDVVAGVSKKEVSRAVSVTFGKTTVTTSESHRFFTSRGWVSAASLRPGDTLVQTASAMRLLRNNHYPKGERLWSRQVLHDLLLNEMVDANSRLQEQSFYAGASCEDGSRTEEVSAVRISRSTAANRASQESKPHFSSGGPEKTLCVPAGNGSQAAGAWWEWTWAHEAGSSVIACSSALGMEVESRRLSGREDSWLSHLLQNRSSQSQHENRDRSRWEFASFSQSSRREEDCETLGTRVDRVEILESGDSRLDQFRDASGKLYFYDLQAARHKSFSVEGHLVHNCSMIDTDLMACLLSAIGKDTKLLLVGDPFQLPPVGHGKPFADMINSRAIPHGHLSEVHRYAGRIAAVCNSIKQGEVWTPSAKICIDHGTEYPENLLHIEARSSISITTQLRDLLQKVTSKDPTRATRNFDPIRDVQVLVATNKSRDAINTMLQQLFNAHGEVAVNCPFRVGDKVICTRNMYFFQVDAGDAEEKHYIANGDIGVVTFVSQHQIRVMFTDRHVQITNSFWEHISLAYAITVHKSQGSQWPVVVIVADDSRAAAMVANRSWWYTAISRASKMCCIVGPRAVINKHCEVISLDERDTFLRKDLEEWTESLKSAPSPSSSTPTKEPLTSLSE